MANKGTEMTKPKRVLIMRLSSLGDVVLSTAVLDSPFLAEAQKHWLVAKEYKDLLEHDSRISKLWVFDRSHGFLAWLSLCRELVSQDFDLVLDLHRSLRTRIALVLFIFLKRVKTEVRTVSKQRVRLYSYFLFKELLPKRFRPESFLKRFSKIALGTGKELPKIEIKQSSTVREFPYQPQTYLAVMPSSAWPAKQWGAEKFAEVLEVLKLHAVILGRTSDFESVRLIEILKQKELSFIGLLDAADLSETSFVLKNALAYLGCDTGLSHLAEAVGTPACVIYGPTRPDAGFCVSRSESVSVFKNIWCSPCGKDGRYCIRAYNPHICMTSLGVDDVVQRISSITSRVETKNG